MEKIAVVTDTGSNLSFAQAKELGIYLLPLQITIDETTYQDTLEISTQDIYNELANGKMPKTSMAAYQKIYDLFEELKKDYDTIFAVPLTNGLSTNASTMQSIARELEMNVHSLICMQHAHLKNMLRFGSRSWWMNINLQKRF